MAFIQNRRIAGRRIGYVDVHLLASALLMQDAEVGTFDKSLAAVAAELGLLADPAGSA